MTADRDVETKMAPGYGVSSPDDIGLQLPVGERPLVTFALFAYNQEKYIREAVDGAFAQTYQPLEIILSDDCSTDRTFEIMQEIAGAYQGPHRVRVRKSFRNRRLLGHINDVAELAEGEIVVLAAGDDISFPGRTSELLSIYIGHPLTYAACSDFVIFSGKDYKAQQIADGGVRQFTLLRNIMNFGGCGQGSTYSYRKKCFEWPSKLPEYLELEDRILPTRAALLGRVAFSKKRLVKWRTPTEQGLEREKLRWSKHEVLSKNSEYIRNTISLAYHSRQLSAVEYFIYGIILRASVLRLWHREQAAISISSKLIARFIDIVLFPASLILRLQRLLDPYVIGVRRYLRNIL